ncbi:zinc finger CCCH domain-containing protein 12-like isoform X2 [Rutidosis leptorrhynchoides]|uniref:zinc finger CCCH domain-containing protein 12-like isoform X2 n=1 Tax=Rutidosis leptorrhynchoides TaxID=125765 RepID=UPI003A990318
MDSGFNGENVIHLIGGDESSNQVNKPLSLEEFEHPNTSFDANPDLTDEGDAFTMEIDRSRKTRLCKTFLAKGSCPFGDECVFIHDDVSRNRENTAILLVDARYRSVGPAPVAPPLAPLPSRPPVLLPPAMPPAKPPAVPIEQEGSNDTVKPINWRTRICRRWEQAGYCQYGSKCLFAHGVAVLDMSHPKSTRVADWSKLSPLFNETQDSQGIVEYLCKQHLYTLLHMQ